MEKHPATNSGKKEDSAGKPVRATGKLSKSEITLFLHTKKSRAQKSTA